MMPRIGQATLSVPVLGGVGGILAGVFLVMLAGQASPLLAAIAMGALLVVAAMIVSPTLGLFLTAVVIPIERLGRFTEDSSSFTVSLMRIVGAVAVASFLLHALLKKEPLRFGPAFVLCAIYWGFAVAAVFHSEDRINAVRYSASILGNLAFLFLLLNMVRSWRHARIAVLLWLAVSVTAGGYTIYGWHFGQDVEDRQIGVSGTRASTTWRDASEWENLAEERRAIGPTSHAAVYGINLILTLPFLAYLFRTQRGWPARTGIAASTAVVGYNLLLTNTRSVVLVSAVVLTLCMARRLLLVTPRGLVSVLVLGVVALWFVPDTVYSRALDVSNYTSARSGTLRIRWEYWQAALEIIQGHWLTGIGVGNSVAIPRFVKNEFAGPSASAHNEYLQTLMEVGVLGWLAFFGFIALVLWYSARAGAIFRRFDDAQEQYWFMVACQIATLGVLCYGVQVDVFHFPLKGWWLVAGITCVMYRFARAMGRRPNPPGAGSAPVSPPGSF